MAARKDWLPVGKHAQGSQAGTPLSLDLPTLFSHCHIMGATGWGKSGFINSVLLGIFAKHHQIGTTVIDLKGETAADLLDRFVPALHATGQYPHLHPSRILSIQAFPTRFGVPLDPTKALPECLPLEVRSSIVCNLVGALLDGFGLRMKGVLLYALRAVMSPGVQGSLLDARRLLVDDDFRQRLANRVADPEVATWLRETFDKEPSSSKDSVRARLDLLLLLPILRRALTCGRALSADSLLSGNTLTVVDLSGAPQGQIALGRFVGGLIWQMCVSACMTREVTPNTPHRLLVCDEWQELLAGSGNGAEDFTRLLSLLRFKRVGLWLANQNSQQISQVSPALIQSLRVNCALQVLFRPDASSGDLKHLLPLLPVTGCRVDARNPNAYLPVEAEQKAMLAELATLPKRTALLANRVAGTASVIQTLSLPYERALTRTQQLPEATRARFRQGCAGVPLTELQPQTLSIGDVPSSSDAPSAPAPAPASAPTASSPSRSRRRRGRPSLKLP